MRRICSTAMLVLILVSALLAPWVTSPQVASAADCRFVLGFKAVHDTLPDVVGECLVNEHYNPENGDALQETTKGLLVWRKSDNFTAFTDGYRTWVDGPSGLQQRLNTERFDWEPVDPQAIALNLNDVPAGFSTIPSSTKYTSNDYTIKQSKDPAKVAVEVVAWGRTNGYIATFEQMNTAGFGDTITVANDVDIFNNPDGAHAAFDDWDKTMSQSLTLSPVSAPHIGEESKAFRSSQLVGKGNNKTPMTLYFVVFRKGSVLSSITTFAITPAANFADAINDARITESRIK